MTNKYFLPILCFSLAGCVAVPPPSEIAVAPRRVLNSQEQKIISDVISGSLKDPSAAQFKFPNLVIRKNEHGGYPYCAQVNGKNAFGAYVGFSWALMVAFPAPDGNIRSANLIRLDAGNEAISASICADYGY